MSTKKIFYIKLIVTLEHLTGIYEYTKRFFGTVWGNPELQETQESRLRKHFLSFCVNNIGIVFFWLNLSCPILFNADRVTKGSERIVSLYRNGYFSPAQVDKTY